MASAWTVPQCPHRVHGPARALTHVHARSHGLAQSFLPVCSQPMHVRSPPRTAHAQARPLLQSLGCTLLHAAARCLPRGGAGPGGASSQPAAGTAGREAGASKTLHIAACLGSDCDSEDRPGASCPHVRAQGSRPQRTSNVPTRGGGAEICQAPQCRCKGCCTPGVADMLGFVSGPFCTSLCAALRGPSVSVCFLACLKVQGGLSSASSAPPHTLPGGGADCRTGSRFRSLLLFCGCCSAFHPRGNPTR